MNAAGSPRGRQRLWRLAWIAAVGFALPLAWYAAGHAMLGRIPDDASVLWTADLPADGRIALYRTTEREPDDVPWCLTFMDPGSLRSTYVLWWSRDGARRAYLVARDPVANQHEALPAYDDLLPWVDAARGAVALVRLSEQTAKPAEVFAHLDLRAGAMLGQGGRVRDPNLTIEEQVRTRGPVMRMPPWALHASGHLLAVRGPLAASIGHRLLRAAVRRQDATSVRRILATGVRPDAAPTLGGDRDDTLLLEAVGSGNAEVVQLLLDRGASPNRLAESGEMPLEHAAASGCLPVMRTLIRHGARVNDGEQRTSQSLWRAAETGHPQAVLLLLRSGANPDTRTRAMGSLVGYLKDPRRIPRAEDRETIRILRAWGAPP